MKYQCVSCKEIFNEDEIVMTGINTGWSFYSSTVLCNDCFELYQKSGKSCIDCEYQKNERKFLLLTEPCKGCKNHSNWEDKGKHKVK